MRLIDADPLENILSLRRKQLIDDYETLAGAVSGLLKLVKIQPTVDAVPVVRCKDCKNYDENFDCIGECGFICPHQDDFCSLGERKDSENENNI